MTLVALAPSAELDNDGGQCAVFPSAAAQRGIPGGHIDQVVQLGASQTERLAVLDQEKAPVGEIGLALRTPQVAQSREHHDLRKSAEVRL